MSAATILELRHAECETPGTYLPSLTAVAEVVTVRAWRDPLPTDPTAFAAIVVMGGPMGADDGPTLPWIDDELAFLRSAITHDVPIWGVCLGSQLLAVALGAQIAAAPTPELGVAPVALTDAGRDDPVWGFADAAFPALHWHFDTFTLPPGATLLATTPNCPHQLFRHGSHYGIQFHLEVDAPLVAEWLDDEGNLRELEEAAGPGSAARMAGEVAHIEPVTAPMAADAMRRWLDAFVAQSPI